MDIEEEIDDPEIIDPYEIEEGELPPPPSDSGTSSDSKPEVEAEDEDEDEAPTVGTITRTPYSVQSFLGTAYVGSESSRKVFSPGPIGKDVDILHRKVKGLAQQMFERANAEFSTLKRLAKGTKQEKEKIEQAFRHVIDWIRKQFGVEIPPCMGDGDATTLDNTHP
nr:hypothetical protein [Tanacetum cinerariifolium]